MEGYAYGQVSDSPVTLAQLEELKQSVLLGDDDIKALRTAGEVLADQVEDVLDVWYGFVGAHPFLLDSFTGPDGTPDGDYLARVRARFGQWILDTCNREYDETWLAWQHEVALRHSREKKNATDGAEAPTPVPLRFVIALIYPISATIRPFLAKKGHAEGEVEAMWQAWFKAVTLQVALWSRAYADRRDW